MNEKKPLLLLVGPTAVGKTSISLEIATRLGTEIISADSMQIYKYMDVGTAKISRSEMKDIKHYLIDEAFPNQEFTVADYQKQGNKWINKILEKGKLPMVVGGTGLYINSLVYNLDFTKVISDWQLRNKYKRLSEEYGNQHIYDALKKVDPKSAQRIHLNDTKRIIRALEVYYITGKPMSEHYNHFRQPNPNYDIAAIALTMDRKKLYQRINQRVDYMLEQGLINEVKNLLAKGYKKDSVALQGLGYKEIIQYLEGVYSLDEAIELLKRDTRRFAKRQLTWFKRDKRIEWVNLDSYESKKEACDYIMKYFKKKLASNKIFNDFTYGGDFNEK